MDNTADNNRDILTSSLFQVCAREGSGTLFIITHDNISAQFIIKHGEVTGFSFGRKNGVDAIDDFKESFYWKSQFIKDYEFPLTSAAKIGCSHCLLNEFGYNKFLIDQCNKSTKQPFYKCLKPESFVSGITSFV